MQKPIKATLDEHMTGTMLAYKDENPISLQNTVSELKIPSSKVGISPAERLIVALDVPSAKLAEQIVDMLGERVSFYKIGLQLLSSPEGFALSKKLSKKNKNIFLDYKFSDIGNTIKNAVDSVKKDKTAKLLTVMGEEEIVYNAANAARGTELKILAVTVLTTWTEDYLKKLNINGTLQEHVIRKANIAKEAGAHGVIASALEVKMLKDTFGTDFLVVTPGIRPSGSNKDDQKRTATPYEAISLGADYIVVGRPITKSDDPFEAAENIIKEIEAGRAFYEKSLTT